MILGSPDWVWYLGVPIAFGVAAIVLYFGVIKPKMKQQKRF